MPSEAYIRRIGGMAVALGLGAAVVSGWSSGPAWADDSPGTDGSSASSNETGPNNATAEPDASARESDAPAVKSETTDADDPVPSGSTDASETAKPPAPSIAEGSSNKPAKRKGSEGATAKPTKTKAPKPVSDVADAKHEAPPAVEQNIDADNRFTNVVDVPDRRRDAVSLPTVTTHSLTVATPAPSAPSPPPVVGVVSRLVTGVVNAILSPFAATGAPGTPAAAPSMWALLAFVRREFESAVRSLIGHPGDAQTTSATTPPDADAQSEQRTLILSAFPAEADAILARTTLDPNPSVVVDGHHFYLGTLGGKKVIVGMTGIGMVNATQTTETALDYFTPESGISIDAVVFSGVAGGSGRTEIGSVAVPARWTSDDGETWHAVDADMLATANALSVDLLSSDTIGDPNCYCGLFAGPTIDLNREPHLFVGGDGSSDDNNNGTAFPAIPFGGDIFGPQPCAAPDFSPLFFGNFLQAVGPFLAFGLLTNLTGLLSPMAPPVDAVDQETAAAQQVADAHGIPFLGIRGMSDGPGDPLHLPGYPFTFVVYKQIAADNAAIVTEAFLRSWNDA
jgi:nucleoside phosphorylase